MLDREFEDLQEALTNYNRAIALYPNASDYNDRGLLKRVSFKISMGD